MVLIQFHYLKIKAQILVASGTENGDEAHDDDIVTKFGAIVAERKNSKVVHYVEKPSSSISKFRQDSTFEILLNGGIYIFDRSILDLLTLAEIKKNSIQFDDGLDDNDSNDNDNSDNVLSLELDVLRLYHNLTIQISMFSNQMVLVSIETATLCIVG